MSTFSARVQFLDDTDPFSSTTYPEPSRPPTFTFLLNVHLVNQLSGVHKLLSPPHKVSNAAIKAYLLIKQKKETPISTHLLLLAFSKKKEFFQEYLELVFQ